MCAAYSCVSRRKREMVRSHARSKHIRVRIESVAKRLHREWKWLSATPPVTRHLLLLPRLFPLSGFHPFRTYISVVARQLYFCYERSEYSLETRGQSTIRQEYNILQVERKKWKITSRKTNNSLIASDSKYRIFAFPFSYNYRTTYRTNNLQKTRWINNQFNHTKWNRR